MDRIDWAALLLGAALISFQIFLPPVIGLADDGDFPKITGRFDLYLPNGQANGFIDQKYVIDPRHHWRGEHISSEIVLAALAVGLNRLFSSTTFDLRWIGLVHGALYLLAFYLALPLLRSLPLLRRLLILAAIILILGDTMFVSALNSFYMDTAAWIFLCLCTVLYLRALRRPGGNRERALLLLCVLFLMTAKTQHLAAGLIVCLLILIARRQLRFERIWLALTVATAALGMLIGYLGTPWDYSSIQPFNIIFYGLLPHSDNVHRDLAQLGLDDSYKRWIGMHTYSEGSPMLDMNFIRTFKQRTGFGHVGLFYARHPGQAWRIFIEAVSEAGRERPYLGNYDRKTGVREFQESNAFAAWSTAKRALFYHRGRLYLASTLALIALLCFLAYKQPTPGILTAAAAFAVMLVLELLISSLGDVLDTLRHHFVFNGLWDLCLVLVIGLAASMGIKFDLTANAPQ